MWRRYGRKYLHDACFSVKHLLYTVCYSFIISCHILLPSFIHPSLYIFLSLLFCACVCVCVCTLNTVCVLRIRQARSNISLYCTCFWSLLNVEGNIWLQMLLNAVLQLVANFVYLMFDAGQVTCSGFIRALKKKKIAACCSCKLF